MSLAEQRPLDRVDWLRLLPAEHREKIASLFEEVGYGFGEVIIAEGDPADAFYIITTGRARVVTNGENGQELFLNNLSVGDQFGEIALLQGGRRTATVRASGPVSALKLSREHFLALVEHNPALKVHLETLVRHRELHNYLRQSTLLKEAPLQVVSDLLSRLHPVNFRAGEKVISQGDPAGPMYIVREGRLTVTRQEDGRETRLAFLRAGDYFGEMSVLTGAPRGATVTAFTDCELLGFSADSLQELVGQNAHLASLVEQRIAQYKAQGSVARVPLDFHEAAPLEDGPAEPAADGEQRAENAAGAAQAGPSDQSGAEDELRRKHKLKRFRFVAQADEMDCGAAALTMVLKLHGGNLSMARVRQLTHTSLSGTTLRAICQAAGEAGLAARAVKVPHDRVSEMPTPAILHWEGNHWVVLLEIDGDMARIADPATGVSKLPLYELRKKWSGYAALFDYTTALDQTQAGESPLAWLAGFLKPHAGALMQVLLLALVAASLTMLMPVFTQVVVDRVIVEKNIDTLYVVLGGMAATLVFMLGASLLNRYLLAFLAVRVDSAVLDFLTRKLLSLPLSYFHTRKTGDILRRLAGARQVREFVINSGVGGMLALSQLAVAMFIMSLYSTKLFLAFLAISPVFVVLMLFSSKVLRPLFSQMEEVQGRYHSQQIDVIKGIEAVKAAGAEDSFREKMLARFLELAERQFKSNFIIMGYESGVAAAGFLANLVFLWLGAKMVIAGEISIGAFVAFNTLIAMAYGPLTNLLGLWDNWQLVKVLLSRLEDVFAHPPEQGWKREHLRPVPELAGQVEVSGLSFRYGGPDSPLVLKDVSLSAPAGATIGIVGRSGSGKTTLVKCLAGLLTPSSGRVELDGVDLNQLNHKDLRRNIGLVLQDSYVFSDSIANNIALGDPEPDLERLEWAARSARAHDFIMRLPAAYQTKVGESGLSLSGGQRQRLSIARALYFNPSLLIFDEATAALDSETERAVNEALTRLMRSRTTFLIAHRLSTVREADQIVVLDKGRVVERGNHEELMSRRGLYFYLVSQQLDL